MIFKDICEDKHKCQNIPTAFCWATGNKTQIKSAEDRVHERIQITGSSPNDHTDNKTLLENQNACGNKHVRINRALGSVSKDNPLNSEEKKKHILFAGLVIDSCSKWKDYVPRFLFILLCVGIKVAGNKLRQWETKLAPKTGMNKQIQTNKPWKKRDYWATLGVVQSLQQHECVIKPADVLRIFNSIILLDETKSGKWW